MGNTYILQGILVGRWQGGKLGLRVVWRQAFPQRPELSRACLLQGRGREGSDQGASWGTKGLHSRTSLSCSLAQTLGSWVWHLLQEAGLLKGTSLRLHPVPHSSPHSLSVLTAYQQLLICLLLLCQSTHQ
jgi:hypothetical protein